MSRKLSSERLTVKVSIDGARQSIKGRVCFLTSSFPRWKDDSSAPFLLDLAHDVQSHGWHVDVIAPHAPDSNPNEKLDNISIYRFRYVWPESQETLCYQGGVLPNLKKNPLNWAKIPMLVVAQFVALNRAAITQHIRIIHAHWILPQGVIAVLIGSLHRIPVVISVHGSDIFALQSRFATALKRFALQRAKAVTVNSSATQVAVSNLLPNLKQLHRIPMGVKLSATPTPGQVANIRNRYRRYQGPLIAFVGRLVPQKGVDDLIVALSLVIGTKSNATLVILGDGPERTRLDTLSKQLGLADHIAFTGAVPPKQVHAHLLAADIFVAPYRRDRDGSIEAQGVAILEAMLVGLPVIATATGGIPDIIRPEETGILVDENAADQISDAILRLVRDPSFATRLALRGKTFAGENYAREKTAHIFDLLYTSIL